MKLPFAKIEDIVKTAQAKWSVYFEPGYLNRKARRALKTREDKTPKPWKTRVRHYSTVDSNSL